MMNVSKSAKLYGNALAVGQNGKKEIQGKRRGAVLMFAAVAAVLPVMGSAAQAAVIYWDNGAGTGSWATAGNWSNSSAGDGGGGSVPLTTDDVVFNATSLGDAAVSVSLGGSNRTVNALDVSTAGGLTITGANTLTITNYLTGTGALILQNTGSSALLPNDPTKTGGITIQLGGGFGSGTDWTFSRSNPFGNNVLTTLSGRIRPTTTDFYLREVSWGGGSAYNNFEFANASGTVRLTAIGDAVGGIWNGTARAFAKYGPGQQTMTRFDMLSPDVYAGELRFNGTVNTTTAASTASMSSAIIRGDGILTYDYAGGLVGGVGGTPGGPVAPNNFNGGTLRTVGGVANYTSGDARSLFLADATASTIDMQNNTAFTVTLNGWGNSDGNAYRRGTDAASQGRGAQMNVKTSDGALSSASLNRIAVRNTGSGFKNGILVGAFANGTDFIKNASSFWTAFTVGDYNAGFSVSSTENARLTALTTTLSGAEIANAIKLDAAANAVDIALAGNMLTLGGNTTGAAGTILKTGANASTISGGTLSTSGGNGSTNRDYVVRVNEGTLTISSIIDLPNATVLAKAGTGLLVLTPSSLSNADATDSIAASEGAIRLNPTDFSSVNLQLAGGVFELTGDIAANLGTGAGEVRWNTNTGGGFAAKSAARTVNLSSGATLSWGLTNFVGQGLALKFGSATADNTVTLSNAIDLGTTAGQMWFREVNVTAGAGGDKAILSGQITGGNQYHLLKTGSGTLELTNANNTYAGETMIYAGRLNVNGTLAAVSYPSHATVTAMNGGTLGGTGTINRKVVIESGGTLSPGTSVGTLAIGSTLNLKSGSISNFEITGNASSNTYDKVTSLTSIIYGGTLNVSFLSTPTGPGTYQLFSASSFSGDFSSVVLPAAPGGLAWQDFGSGDYFNNATGSIALIAPAGAPKFTISPGSVSLATLKGATPVTATLTLTNTGTASGDTTVDAGTAPLSVSPTTHTSIDIGGTANSIVSLATGGYASGSENIDITQNAATSNTFTTVNYNVGNAAVGTGNTFGAALTGTSNGADLASITSNTEAIAISIDSSNSLTMDWRSAKPAETFIVGDVVRIDTVNTDIYVLKMTYSTDINENSFFLGRELGLNIWGAAGNEMSYAKQLNFSYDQGALGLADDLGRWGIVTTGTGGYVWAVVQGDGTFAVIPEPASLGLLGLGAVGLLMRSGRRRTVR